jgi:PBSX family phage terminase large subunit
MINKPKPNLSPKQKKAFKEATSRLNIWCGAVRSGKTYSSIIKFIDLLLHGPKGDTIVIGVTRDSIQRNVLTDLCNLIGARVPASKSSEMVYLGRKVYFVGASDERAVRRIQGSTLALAYVDECAEIPEPFWNMLLSRLSIPGAQLLGTCNPSYPNHWLKKKYLDLQGELNLSSWQFTLEDNPILTDEYKRDLKKEYTGMWYKRYILGEWAVAHGLVYDQFDNDNIYTEEIQNPTFSVVGIDYGSANPTAAVLLCCNPRKWPQLWVKDTYYFNSATAGRGKTDAELADDLENWIRPYNIDTIYLDPSAKSLNLEMSRRGIPVSQAKNDVMSGIQVVSKFVGGKNLLVNARCKELIDELKSYSWDPKSIERGEDKVIKKNDHLCDALRYSIFSKFPDGSFEHFEQDYSMEAVRKRAYGEPQGMNGMLGFSGTSYF